MEIGEIVAQYGIAGVALFLVLRWAQATVDRVMSRFSVLEDWTRETLYALVKDCTAELAGVRRAIEAAPCGRNGRVGAPGTNPANPAPGAADNP